MRLHGLHIGKCSQMCRVWSMMGCHTVIRGRLLVMPRKSKQSGELPHRFFFVMVETSGLKLELP